MANRRWHVYCVSCQVPNAQQDIDAVLAPPKPVLRGARATPAPLASTPLLSTTSLWSNVHKNMPKNIFNFTLKYLSNNLATIKNLSKWFITQSPACSFCLQSETLQHIVSSCKSYLEQGRYTWRHDSVLNFIENTFPGLQSCSLYADLPVFLSPSPITGDSLRPDLILIAKNNDLYILEPTIGYETNITFNSHRKASKYNPLHEELGSK